MEKNQSLEMAKLVIDALEDKKAEDIRVIDISEVSVIADLPEEVTGARFRRSAIMWRRSWGAADTRQSRSRAMTRRTGFFWTSGM